MILANSREDIERERTPFDCFFGSASPNFSIGAPAQSRLAATMCKIKTCGPIAEATIKKENEKTIMSTSLFFGYRSTTQLDLNSYRLSHNPTLRPAGFTVVETVSPYMAILRAHGFAASWS